jgi:hypothetical protein
MTTRCSSYRLSRTPLPTFFTSCTAAVILHHGLSLPSSFGGDASQFQFITEHRLSLSRLIRVPQGAG